MHQMATTPGALRQTVAGVVSDPDLASMRRNNDVLEEMRRERGSGAAGTMGPHMRRRANILPGGVGGDMFGGGDSSLAIPRFYDPMQYWEMTGLPWNMADEGHRHKLHKWLRLYNSTHYLIGTLIDLFTRFPLVGLTVECTKDKAIADFYEHQFIDILQYPEFLVSLGREFMLIGEAFPLGSFNENLGIWEHEELLNPENIIIKNFPLLDSKQIFVKPPDYLVKLAREKSPAREYKMLLDQHEDLIPFLLKNENIPISDVLLKQIANKATDWDDHGTPNMLRVLRTLLYEEKLLASQEAIAERLYSPFILAKLGIQDLGDGQPPWIPTFAEVEEVKNQIDLALASDFRLMVHHFGLDIQNVFGREQMPRLGDDFDRIERRIMQAWGVNPSLLSAGAATQPYASSALNAEFLNQFMKTYQNYLKKHFLQRAAVVAEAQGHYDYEMNGSVKVPIYETIEKFDEEGEAYYEEVPKLLLPTLSFQNFNLRDEATERQFLQALRAQGIPLADQTLAIGVDFDMEEERRKANDDLIKKTVELAETKFKAYTILRERNLPIPPDLKMEVEGLLAPGMPPMAGGGEPSPMGGQPGGAPPPGGPGGPGGIGMGGPMKGPGPIIAPTMPQLGPGGIGNPMGQGGAPARSPQPATGPGGGVTAPPVSMERRRGMPQASVTAPEEILENSELEKESATIPEKEEVVPEKIVIPPFKNKTGKKYSFIDESQRMVSETDTKEEADTAGA